MTSCSSAGPRVRCSSHDGSTPVHEFDIGPSFVESRSPSLGTCQSMLAWFDPTPCGSRLYDLLAGAGESSAGQRRLGGCGHFATSIGRIF